MNPGSIPHVDFQFDSLAAFAKVHQEHLRSSVETAEA
jgi:hypothetical protein